MLIVYLLVTKVQHLPQPCKFFAKKSKFARYSTFSPLNSRTM